MDRGGTHNSGLADNAFCARTTTGWRPTCTYSLDPVPDVVLDPFAGSGTVLAVAVKHARKAIGIELSEEYCELIQKRVSAAIDDWGLFKAARGEET
jgi:hypothetical protein